MEALVEDQSNGEPHSECLTQHSGKSELDVNRENPTGDDEAHGLMDQVFANPLIFKHILSFLRYSHLLDTSAVSKSWNFWSREILRERKCLASTSRRQSEQEEIKKLNLLLTNSINVPFNGLRICVGHGHDEEECVEPAYEDITGILNKIRFKYLAIHWSSTSWCGCTSFPWLKQIWESAASSLEGLRLEIYCNGETAGPGSKYEEMLQIDMGTFSLPELRQLEICFKSQLSSYRYCRPPSDFVNGLVKASPKLQVFGGYGFCDKINFVSELELAHMVKRFKYSPIKEPHFHDSIIFALKRPRLISLQIGNPANILVTPSYYIWMDLQPDMKHKMTKTLELLLDSSQHSLRQLVIHLLDLVWMTEKCEFPVLPGLESMEIIFSEQERHYGLLRKINWKKLFPNLKYICIKNTDYHWYSCVDFKKIQLDGHINICESVTALRMEIELIKFTPNIGFFRDLFPNVKQFYLTNDYTLDLKKEMFLPFLNDLWSAWEDLEGLSIGAEELDIAGWMPSILDISVEEGLHLMDRTKDFRSLNIVPSKPGLCNLKRLKTLALPAWKHNCGSGNPESKRLLELLGPFLFRRMSNLDVQIAVEPCQPECDMNLAALKSFVKFLGKKRFTHAFQDKPTCLVPSVFCQGNIIDELVLEGRI